MSTGTIPPISQWKRWQPAPPVLAAWGVLVVCFLVTYWSTIRHVVGVWCNTPDYEHGFFVPIFACFILWLRQDMVDPWPTRGAILASIPFFVVWALFRWMVVYLNYERDIDSLFPFLIGMTLLLGGWRALRWAWPSILFLIFMVPLPARVAESLARPLQRVATIMSVYTLQTLGIPAIVRGDQSNVIQLSNPAHQLEVATACSGLRMLTLFFAVCVGASFLMKVRLWEKIILVISAVPIAIISNVARIVLDGVLTEWVSPEAGNFIHDKAGWLMMPLAMLMIWGEMSLLAALLIDSTVKGPLSFGDGNVSQGRRGPPAGGSLLGPMSGGPPRSPLR